MHNFKELLIWKRLLSNDLGFVTESELKDVLAKLEEIQKMIFGFIQKLKASDVIS